MKDEKIADRKSVRVCLVAIPEVMASTLMGLYDVLNSFNLLSTYSDGLAARAHFKAEIVATAAGSLTLRVACLSKASDRLMKSMQRT